MGSSRQRLYDRLPQATVLHIVLPVVLLCMQMGLLSHELHHFGDGDSPECMLCLVSDHTSDALPAASALVSIGVSQPVPVLPSTADEDHACAAYTARAPPMNPRV